jgi:hypothetical protein
MDQVTQNQADHYDFPVKLQPMYLHNNEAQVPRLRAVVRQDTNEPIGVVSTRYRLITHSQALDYVSPFTKALGNAETKFFLEKNGARLVARYTYFDRTVPIRTVGDTVALRVDVINSYDGSEPLRFNIGALVLRCLNGMTAVAEAIGLRFRHIGDESLSDIVLPNAESVWQRFVKKADTWERWTALPNSPEYVTQVLGQLVAANVIGSRFIEDKKTNLLEAPTRWEFYDRMTYAITHDMPRLKESERIRRLRSLDHAFSTTTTTVSADA